jgi:hypothetical protein
MPDVKCVELHYPMTLSMMTDIVINARQLIYVRDVVDRVNVSYQEKTQKSASISMY